MAALAERPTVGAPVKLKKPTAQYHLGVEAKLTAGFRVVHQFTTGPIAGRGTVLRKDNDVVLVHWDGSVSVDPVVAA